MSIKIGTAGGYLRTRNALVDTLSAVETFLVTAPYSDDPASDFQRGHAALDTIVAALRALVVNRLKEIDESIRGGPLIAEIDALSRKARVEADRIANVADTLAQIGKAVDAATKVITKIGGLPFFG